MLSRRDRLLLRQLQSDFPLIRQPYLGIAKRLKFSEKEVLRKAKLFCDKGVIRYIGPIFNQKKMGIVSSLVAFRVPKKNLSKAVKIINAYPQVTHNYLRLDTFNLWFTVSAASKSSLLKLIRQIKKKTGVKEALNLITERVFKIDARFGV